MRTLRLSRNYFRSTDCTDIMLAAWLPLLAPPWNYINQVSAEVIEAFEIGRNLNRNVSSNHILDRYENGECVFPGCCDIPINECNIDRVPLSTLSHDDFITNYVQKEKPVLIQLCDDPNGSNDCDLSFVLDNSTGIWEWNQMISAVRPLDYLNIYRPMEQHGTPKDRAETCDIHPLNDRDTRTYRQIIDSIHGIPRILEDLDFFNDLIGYLQTADGPLLGNKWIVFGNTGSGAQFHFDYYWTSFWNLVVEGSKYWLLVDPEVVETYLLPKEEDLHRVITMPLWQFWIQIYPFIDHVIAAQKGSGDDGDGPSISPPYYQCMQRKGEIMYAPSKMYHSTVNLNASLSISRNMITPFNYRKVFEFITSLQSMHSIDTDSRAVIGVHHAMNLCAALYHYNSAMWKNTHCATKVFLQRLNSFDWVRESQTVTNAEVYIEACNFAKEHAQFSAFR